MSDLRIWQIAGWTMLHYLWVGGALGAIALIMRRLLTRRAANLRYLAALGCFAVLGAAPLPIAVIVTSSLPPPPQSQPRIEAERGFDKMPMRTPLHLPAAEEPAESAATDPAIPSSPPPAPAPQRRDLLRSALDRAAMDLPWLWLVGAPITFLLTTLGLVGAQRLRRQSRLLEDSPIVDTCRRLAAALKISQRVTVGICDRIAAPILVGIFRPLILLPAAALTGWDSRQLEMVLWHELAHVRRYDNLVNLVQRIVESVLFFHPLVWIVSGWVRREREHCCDELVVARTGEPRAYAEILVHFADQVPAGDRAASFALARTVSSMAQRSLVARIRRILKQEEQSMQVSRKAVGLAFVGFLVLAMMIGAYCSRSSNAEDAAKTPTGDKPATAVPPVTNEVSNSNKDLIEKIISRVTENYSRLGGIEATIEEIVVDPNVKERQVITGSTKNGSTFELTREPKTVRIGKVRVRGSDVWSEFKGSQILACFHGIWTQYSPGHKMAWIRRSDQMPGTLPVDPRNVTSMEIDEQFPDQLRDGKVVETRSVREADGRQVVEVLWQYGKGRHKGSKIRYRFDPAMNFLPTKVEWLGQDGTVHTVANIAYQEVIPKTAWFLREAILTFASKQTMTIRAKGEVRIHQKFDDKAFTIDLPYDTLIRNAVDNTVSEYVPTWPDAPKAEPNTDQARAIAEIEKVGGRVIADEKSPGKPVTDVLLDDAKDADPVLASLKGLPQLQALELARSHVTDAGLENLRGMSRLRYLWLSGTQISDAGLEHLKALNELKSLYLDGTKVTDAGLRHLKALSQLRYLNLSGTKVSSAGLEHLKELKQLQELDLRRTEVTGEGAKILQQALPNCRIYRSTRSDEKRIGRLEKAVPPRFQPDRHGVLRDASGRAVGIWGVDGNIID